MDKKKELKIIFDGYAKNCYSYFKQKNFDDLQIFYLNSNMFLRFCKDFQITEFNKYLLDKY